jgi:3-phenylpropionate/trans-cinnamate dioxygenase ferredoxin reductase component
MIEDPAPIVVVGAGMAGGRAAQVLARHKARDRDVVLIGDEPHRPYRRPPLSKHGLTEDLGEQLFLHKPPFYEDNSVTLRLSERAVKLNPSSKTIVLADGSKVRYSRAILTPGCVNRALPVPGADLPGVLYLRTLTESEELRRRLAGAHDVVIVGGGFIGTEIAATCRSLGKTVTIVEAGPALLWSVLGSEIGDLVQRRHEANGVHVRTGEFVSEIEGDDRVRAVRLQSGASVPADLVVVGIGVEPNTRWLVPSGIKLDNGIVVDDHCRTNIEDVYAAGDVARWNHPSFGSLRTEHEANAHQQASVAARNAMGEQIAYDAVPYSWSDQGGMRLRYVGHASVWDETRTISAGDSLTVLYLWEGVVRAVFCLDDMDAFDRARQLFQHEGCFWADHWASTSTV